MGKIITLTGKEDMGVTTTSLMLAKTISQILNKEILLIDLNIKKPEVYKILFGKEEEESTYNIDLIMEYAMSEKDIEEIVKVNTQEMSNSKLKVIMGTNLKHEYTRVQYQNLFNTVKAKYSFTIIDTSINANECIFDYSDMILLVVDQAKKNLSDVKNMKILSNTKTDVLVNKYQDGLLNSEEIAKMLDKENVYKCYYDKKVVKALNKKTLSVESNIYENSIQDVSNKILKKFGYENKKSNMLEKLFRKEEKLDA